MKYKAGLLAMLILMMATPMTYAQFCNDVEDVLDRLHDENEHYSAEDIKQDCGRTIEDAPNCNIKKIIRLDKKGYDEDQIVDKCSGSRRSQAGSRRRRSQAGQDYRGSQYNPNPGPQYSNICRIKHINGSCLFRTLPLGSPCGCTFPQSGPFIWDGLIVNQHGNPY